MAHEFISVSKQNQDMIVELKTVKKEASLSKAEVIDLKKQIDE